MQSFDNMFLIPESYYQRSGRFIFRFDNLVLSNYRPNARSDYGLGFQIKNFGADLKEGGKT